VLDAGKGRVGGLVGGTIVHFMPVWRMCAALHLHVLSIVTGSAGAMAGSCCFMHRGVCPAQPMVRMLQCSLRVPSLLATTTLINIRLSN
jgi:hypothetical protein